tara:strand:+ start:844 stop:1587 length:744 start_codon:yes stop_codon:yes gene_type:complete
MTHLLKIVYFFLISVVLVACGNEKIQTKSLNSLISPNYSFNQDFFYCDLNKNMSLLNLESFLSKFVSDNVNDFSNILDINILFPDKTQEVTEFVFSVRSNQNSKEVSDFVNLLDMDDFNKIASCNYAIQQFDATDLIQSESEASNDFLNIEILRCTYNPGYNFGTFRISIDRFVNAVGRLKLPYSLSYINLKKNNSFIWINSFNINNQEEFLEKNWISDDESKAIKDEFNENATCLDSKKYKSYELI